MVKRAALISMHTCPLHQPGTGDAGGMNVYLKVLARHLAQAGLEVELFTRATEDHPPGTTPLAEQIIVHHIAAGPLTGLAKEDLPTLTHRFAQNLLATHQTPYDVVHAHYWLSGLAGLEVAHAWQVPLVQTFHTSALVKNSALALGDRPEPAERIFGERRLVAESDLLICNTQDEASQIIELYAADPDRITVITPGVDLDIFTPRDSAEVRRELNIADAADVVMFAGRIQPLKGPQVLLAAVARLLGKHPSRRERMLVPIVGGPSGSGFDQPTWLIDLASELGIADVVRFVPPLPQAELAKWYAAADVVAVPSFNESFGLVAAEAQACGTPVIATNVGGLKVVVAHGTSGLLVDGHDPAAWAEAIESVLSSEEEFDRGAAEHASQFSWDASALKLLAAYAQVVERGARRGSVTVDS